jgi:HK97 family phage prohead protease
MHDSLPDGGTGEIRAKDAGRSADSSEHRDGRAGEGDAGDMCLRELVVRAMSDAATGAPGECWIDVIASTAAIDSYDEIVEQTWDLSRFNANPVVLWAHQSRELPLGYASNVGVVNGALQMRLNFCDATANPMGPQVYALFKQKALRAVSVGFIPRDVRLEMRDGREIFVLSNNLLLEISPTPIGANPEALAKSHARIKALAVRAPTESPAAERGIATENSMTIDKAALDAAEKRATDAEQKAKDLETKLAAEKAVRERMTGALVGALVEAGRFSKDEIEEQKELALSNPGLFEKLAAKRTIRGAEIVGARPLPASPAGGAERAAGDAPAGDLMADAMSAAEKE